MGFPLADLLIPSRSTKKKLYGTKPVYTSPETSAATALGANLANLPKAEELAGKVNTFNQDQIMAMLRKAIPGFDTKVGLQSELLESGLRGEVPADVQKQLKLRAASKSLAGGYAGSGMARNLEARDFGLTSFDITQKALDSNSRWNESMARLTQPALFNIGSSFVPFDVQKAHDDRTAEVKAAPSPTARGAFDSKMGVLGMMLGAYGGAGYQGAYRPSGQQPAPSAPTSYFLQNAQGGGGTGGAPQGWGGGGSVPGGSYSGGEAFDQFGTWNF